MKVDRVERLLEKACYIIDFLPMTVGRKRKGQFFEVEEYLLGSEKYWNIRNRFVSVILKLMCYYHVSVLLGEWVDRPSPEFVEQAVRETEKDGLNVLFPDEDMLLVFGQDSLNMSVYNPPEEARFLMERIAWSEGLFWREAEPG